jgi:hypothetical protein
MKNTKPVSKQVKRIPNNTNTPNDAATKKARVDGK